MARNLFDHIKGVTKDKVKWKDLTEEDQKSWSNFLITRWFSMNIDIIEAINEFQKYSNGILSSKDYYNLLYHAMPKTSFFLKYTKRKHKVEIDNKFITLLCGHYHSSKRKMYEYMRELKKLGNDEELINVLTAYGTLTEDIDLFKKQLTTIK